MVGLHRFYIEQVNHNHFHQLNHICSIILLSDPVANCISSIDIFKTSGNQVMKCFEYCIIVLDRNVLEKLPCYKLSNQGCTVFMISGQAMEQAFQAGSNGQGLEDGVCFCSMLITILHQIVPEWTVSIKHILQ